MKGGSIQRRRGLLLTMETLHWRDREGGGGGEERGKARFFSWEEVGRSALWVSGPINDFFSSRGERKKMNGSQV